MYEHSNITFSLRQLDIFLLSSIVTTKWIWNSPTCKYIFVLKAINIVFTSSIFINQIYNVELIWNKVFKIKTKASANSLRFTQDKYKNVRSSKSIKLESNKIVYIPYFTMSP